MFEKASREKIRFDSSKGLLSVEDLWDLPLTSAKSPSLDGIARSLHQKLKSGDDVSFVEKTVKPNSIETLKFEIVKHIIDVRLAENEAKLVSDATKGKKQILLAAIAQKELEALTGGSLEDLKKMVESM